MKRTVEDRLHPLWWRSNSYIRPGPTSTVPTVVSRTSTVRGCRDDNVGVLEARAFFPFTEHFAGRLDADSAYWFATCAGLTAVKVADAFAGVDICDVGSLFKIVEGVEC